MVDLRSNPFFLDEEGVSWVENTLKSMTTEEKTGQLFCVLFKKAEKSEFDYVLNILSPGACMYRVVPVKNAVNASNFLQRKSRIPLLIAANLEKGGNGIVEEGTLVGSPMAIAATGETEMAQKMATACAREASAVGANWAFAPIVDIVGNFRNPITNTRTFGSNPETVLKLGTTYVKTVQKLGVAACSKHFPGDGRDERDQHLVTVINDLSVDEWMNTYGKVYRACIEEHTLSVMVAHILFPEWSRRFGIPDEKMLPASLSKEITTDLLRKELGFNGLICTDATTMAGYTLAMGRREAVPGTIAAGCDMFLFARNLEEDYSFMLDGVKKGIITEERLDEAVTRILATKAALGLHKGVKKADEKEAVKIVGCPEHKSWAAECADKAITLVKEEKGVLPISPEKYKRILFYTIEPPEGGESSYRVVATCKKVRDKLIAEGFEVEDFVPQPYGEGFTSKYEDFLKKYDLIIYVANLATKSNQTVVRIEWKQPMGADCGHYMNDIPTVFISLENPFHLIDFPRVKTFINCYCSNDESIDALMDKLTGRSPFKGKSPSDPFCGMWDARL